MGEVFRVHAHTADVARIHTLYRCLHQTMQRVWIESEFAVQNLPSYGHRESHDILLRFPANTRSQASNFFNGPCERLTHRVEPSSQFLAGHGIPLPPAGLKGLLHRRLKFANPGTKLLL
jgi:hypothetical protein